MLVELGVYGTIVGHSERRQYFAETDETVGKRAAAALAEGLHVIACVGETEAEREAGQTEQVLRRQVAVLEHDDNLVVAYEPVWGCAPAGPGNAVNLAETPVFDRVWREFPHSTLDASGEAAGLPPGQMGNSEVGHLTIGAGRRLYQDLMRVNKAIKDGSFFENP